MKKKHLIIIGKTEKDRKKYVDNLLENANKTTYRFKSNIKNFDEYVLEVRNIFPFIPPTWEKQNPKKWSIDQVWDFHLDWTEDVKNVIIVLEEFDVIEKQYTDIFGDDWQEMIIRMYYQTTYYQGCNGSEMNFQLIITLPEEGDLIENIIPKMVVNNNEKRTKSQIIYGMVDVINL